jgi:hypothetical protein
MVSEVSAELKGAQAVIVAEYRGLDVGRVTQLRSKARKSGLYLRVLRTRSRAGPSRARRLRSCPSRWSGR